MKYLILVAAAPLVLAAQDKRVDDYMRAEMNRDGIPGISAVVLRDGKVIHQGSYGLANVELGVPVTDKTVFPLASITKTFAATAIMRLVEQGALGLDDDVNALLPEIPAAWGTVKVHHLLGHTSGLPDVVVNPITGTWLGSTTTESLAKLAAMPVASPPGAEWSYNQTNYMLLGMIVEKLSGKPFREFLTETVIDPLGLKTVAFGDSRAIVPGRATWYSIINFADGRPRRARSPHVTWVEYPEFVQTAAGLNATALDVARFAEAVGKGRVLGQGARSRMWTAVSLADGKVFRMEKTLGVGLGWIVDDAPGRRSVGGSGGASVAFRHYPDHGLTVVVLTNLQGVDPDAMTEHIASLYLPVS